MDPVIVDKSPEVPVILLCSLAIDGVITCELCSPISTTPSILAKCRNTSVEVPLTECKRVPLCSLDRPLANKDGELSTAGFLLRVGTKLGWKVGRGGVRRMFIVVDMDIKDKVGVVRYLVVPVVGILEAALEHDGDFRVDSGDSVNNSVDVLRHPRGAIVGQNSWSAEVRHGLLVEVGWFIQGCDGVRLRGTRALDEVDDLVNGLEGLVQGSLIIEPVPMAHSFSNGQTIESSRERMDIDDDVHPVVRDGIVRNVLQVSRLVTRVQLRAGKVDPRRIVSRNTQESHPTLSQMVDILGGDEGGIAMLENRTTSGTKILAEGPFIRRVTAIASPECAVNVGLLDQPASKVDTIGLERPPVDVIGLNEKRDGAQGCEESPYAHFGGQEAVILGMSYITVEGRLCAFYMMNLAILHNGGHPPWGKE